MPSGTLLSPIGPIHLVADASRLLAIRIGVEGEDDSRCPLVREALAQLAAWFAGRVRRFDLPLASARSVRGEALRQAIAAVPHGRTTSYAGLARVASSGPRAIGQACARNPFPIVIPCHRVLASDGLGHYSAGNGIATKRWLLDHERRGGSDG